MLKVYLMVSWSFGLEDQWTKEGPMACSVCHKISETVEDLVILHRLRVLSLCTQNLNFIDSFIIYVCVLVQPVCVLVQPVSVSVLVCV